MHYKTLGERTGFKVSKVALGTGKFGQTWGYGATPERRQANHRGICGRRRQTKHSHRLREKRSETVKHAGLKTRSEDVSEGTPQLGETAVVEISSELSRLLADVFALYLKTKNFHWHMSGPNFRDYHALLDEQAGQIFAMTDDIAERARKIGGNALRSIGHISPEP